MLIREVLAHNLKTLRSERGIPSQDKLAEMADISRGVVARAETAATYPDEATIAALAKALGVPESRLFQDPDSIPTPSHADIVQAVADKFGVLIEIKKPRQVLPSPKE